MKTASFQTPLMQKKDKLIFATLFFSIFTTVTGVGIVVPLLPVYAHNLGASGLYIGMIFGAFSLSRIFFLAYFGRLSDKKGRKPFIVPGLLAYVIISLAFIWSENVNSLIVIRFIQGIASAMLMPVIQAYVGDITPNGREGFTMGLFNMSMFFGLSIGPVLGGIIHDHYSLDVAFISMGTLAFIGFILSVGLLPPTRTEHVLIKGKMPTEWRWLIRDKVIAGLFFYRFAYTACIGIIWSFLPILADFELSLSSAAIGILVMLGIFVSGVIHVPVGYLADRLNKQLMVIIGGLIVALAMVLFNWAMSFWGMVWASVLFGFGGGISMPAVMALAVIKGNKTNAMGSVMAILTLAHSSGMLLGALMAGLMMDLFQLQLAFPMGTGIMLLGLAGFFLLTHPKNSIEFCSKSQL